MTIRFSALLTLFFFFTSNLNTYAASQLPVNLSGLKDNVQDLNPDELRIPSEIGIIQEKYQYTASPAVILIQDAHAIPDAQRSIQRLIEYFQDQYGIKTVALEGASSRLDAQIFRSFPDKERLRQVFEEYMQNGELAGGVAAAISGNQDTHYYGIEDWNLYEDGVRYYQQATAIEDSVMNEITELKEKIENQKKSVYSKELLELDQLLDKFYQNHIHLPEILKELAKIKALAPHSELALLLEESKKEERDSSKIDREVREIAERIHLSLRGGRRPTKQSAFQTQIASLPSGARNDVLIQFNQKYQDFQTSRISGAEFALWIKEHVVGAAPRGRPLPEPGQGFGPAQGPAPTFSSQLLHLLQSQKRLRDIKGTNLFKDFEQYASEVKESLFRNDEEKRLDKQNTRLQLIEAFVKLELSHEQWEEVKTLMTPPSLRATEGREAISELGLLRRPYGAPRNDGEIEAFKLLTPHFKFYETAHARDEKFFRNIQRLMKKEKTNQIIMVAGGFHAHKMAELFKQNQISYILLSPQINHIPETTPYRNQMQGDVSWKNYFEVENGKISLYKAFVRAVRDRLLDVGAAPRGRPQAEHGQGSGPAQGPAPTLLLKPWRDQIIRDLAAQNRIAESVQYTQFIDEVTGQSQKNNAASKLIAAAQKFSSRLRQLHSSGNLTQQNILGLLRPSTTLPFAGAAIASLDRNAFIPSDFIRNETRSIRRSEAREQEELLIEDSLVSQALSYQEIEKFLQSKDAPAKLKLAMENRSVRGMLSGREFLQLEGIYLQFMGKNRLTPFQVNEVLRVTDLALMRVRMRLNNHHKKEDKISMQYRTLGLTQSARRIIYRVTEGTWSAALVNLNRYERFIVKVWDTETRDIESQIREAILLNEEKYFREETFGGPRKLPTRSFHGKLNEEQIQLMLNRVREALDEIKELILLMPEDEISRLLGKYSREMKFREVLGKLRFPEIRQTVEELRQKPLLILNRKRDRERQRQDIKKEIEKELADNWNEESQKFVQQLMDISLHKEKTEAGKGIRYVGIRLTGRGGGEIYENSIQQIRNLGDLLEFLKKNPNAVIVHVSQVIVGGSAGMEMEHLKSKALQIVIKDLNVLFSQKGRTSNVTQSSMTLDDIHGMFKGGIQKAEELKSTIFKPYEARVKKQIEQHAKKVTELLGKASARLNEAASTLAPKDNKKIGKRKQHDLNKLEELKAAIFKFYERSRTFATAAPTTQELIQLSADIHYVKINLLKKRYQNSDAADIFNDVIRNYMEPTDTEIDVIKKLVQILFRSEARTLQPSEKEKQIRVLIKQLQSNSASSQRVLVATALGNSSLYLNDSGSIHNQLILDEAVTALVNAFHDIDQNVAKAANKAIRGLGATFAIFRRQKGEQGTAYYAEQFPKGPLPLPTNVQTERNVKVKAVLEPNVSAQYDQNEGVLIVRTKRKTIRFSSFDEFLQKHQQIPTLSYSKEGDLYVLRNTADNTSFAFKRGSKDAFALEQVALALKNLYEPRSEAREQDKEDWKELAYHLNRLETGDRQAKLLALDGIREGLYKNRSRFLSPGTVQILSEEFQQSQNDSFAQSKILEVLVYGAFDVPAVRQMFAEVLKLPWIEKNFLLMAAGLFGFHILIIHQRARHLSKELKAMDIVEFLFHGLNLQTPEEIGGEALGSLKALLGYWLVISKEKKWEPLVRPSELLEPNRLQILNQIMREHSSDIVRKSAAELLWILGRTVSEEFEYLSTKESDGAFLQRLFRTISKRPLKGELTKEQLKRLYEQIQRAALPKDFLRELFVDKDKKMVFVGSFSEPLGLQKGLARDIEYLSETAGLSHVAFNFPPSLMPSFFAMLERDQKKGRAFFNFLIQRYNKDDAIEVSEIFRKELAPLIGKIEFYFYGAESGLSGENELDSQVYNLIPFFRDRPARVLVYTDASSTFTISKEDLSYVNGNSNVSLVRVLKEQIGEARIASVIQQGETDWAFGKMSRIHNLSDIFQIHSIPTSFALGLGDTEMDDLRFDEDYEDSYGNAWDALIFRIDSGDEDPDFFIVPQLPQPDALLPVEPVTPSSPVLIRSEARSGPTEKGNFSVDVPKRTRRTERIVFEALNRHLDSDSKRSSLKREFLIRELTTHLPNLETGGAISFKVDSVTGQIQWTDDAPQTYHSIDFGVNMHGEISPIGFSMNSRVFSSMNQPDGYIGYHLHPKLAGESEDYLLRMSLTDYDSLKKFSNFNGNPLFDDSAVIFVKSDKPKIRYRARIYFYASDGQVYAKEYELREQEVMQNFTGGSFQFVRVGREDHFEIFHRSEARGLTHSEAEYVRKTFLPALRMTIRNSKANKQLEGEIKKLFGEYIREIGFDSFQFIQSLYDSALKEEKDYKSGLFLFLDKLAQAVNETDDSIEATLAFIDFYLSNPMGYSKEPSPEMASTLEEAFASSGRGVPANMQFLAQLVRFGNLDPLSSDHSDLLWEAKHLLKPQTSFGSGIHYTLDQFREWQKERVKIEVTWFDELNQRSNTATGKITYVGNEGAVTLDRGQAFMIKTVVKVEVRSEARASILEIAKELQLTPQEFEQVINAGLEGFIFQHATAQRFLKKLFEKKDVLGKSEEKFEARTRYRQRDFATRSLRYDSNIKGRLTNRNPVVKINNHNLFDNNSKEDLSILRSLGEAERSEARPAPTKPERLALDQKLGLSRSEARGGAKKIILDLMESIESSLLSYDSLDKQKRLELANKISRVRELDLNLLNVKQTQRLVSLLLIAHNVPLLRGPNDNFEVYGNLKVYQSADQTLESLSEVSLQKAVPALLEALNRSHRTLPIFLLGKSGSNSRKVKTALKRLLIQVHQKDTYDDYKEVILAALYKLNGLSIKPPRSEARRLANGAAKFFTDYTLRKRGVHSSESKEFSEAVYTGAVTDIDGFLNEFEAAIRSEARRIQDQLTADQQERLETIQTIINDLAVFLKQTYPDKGGAFILSPGEATDSEQASAYRDLQRVAGLIDQLYFQMGSDSNVGPQVQALISEAELNEKLQPIRRPDQVSKVLHDFVTQLNLNKVEKVEKNDRKDLLRFGIDEGKDYEPNNLKQFEIALAVFIQFVAGYLANQKLEKRHVESLNNRMTFGTEIDEKYLSEIEEAMSPLKKQFPDIYEMVMEGFKTGSPNFLLAQIQNIVDSYRSEQRVQAAA